MQTIGVEISSRNCGAEAARRWDAGRREPARAKAPRWKRTLDVVCIVLAVPVVVPVGLAIAAMIKLVSRGPVFFKQERVGFRGSRFQCLKFRTMGVNADSATHAHHVVELMHSGRPMEKLDTKGDSRLIPGGRWLRSCGLDELPQLLNVLRGEMSLVGPRPSMPYECERYEPWYFERLDTAPGLTGYWQVNGKNRTTFTQMMDLDVYYVRHRSLLLDCRILARTVPAIVQQVMDQRRKRREDGGGRGRASATEDLASIPVRVGVLAARPGAAQRKEPC